ncbi:MAG: glycerol kinase GlpK, partial [Candidatus Firestonebacteria bacterium]
TTGSRAFIFDQTGKAISSAYQEFKQYYPKPGWVEHDADEIWQSCVTVIKKAIQKAKISGLDIVAIGITNQRETTVLWDRKTSKPICRAIVWQCRRTADICEKLKAGTYRNTPLENIFHKKTGLVLDPYFSGTKIKWCLDNIRGLRLKSEAGKICFGTIDSWLIWKLTGGQSHTTDMTNASRTLLFNIKTKKWDKEILEILGIPKSILPKVQNSGSIFGWTKGGIITGLPDGLPIMAVMGDQQAALYGHGCYGSGQIKNTYGTGSFLVFNTGKKLIYSKQGLLTTVSCDVNGNPIYALEGSIFITGAVVQWMRDELKIIKDSADSEKIIQNLEDSGGVYFVPAFTGLGAPYWNSRSRGLICGLTRGSGQKHIIRAGLESIAYQTKDVFEIMQKSLRKKIKEIHVDGGACRNNFLMQFQADMLGCKVVRPKNIELTAQGVAYLAGITIGLWSKKDINQMNKVDKIFKPKMSINEIAHLYKGWQDAVKRAL